MKKPTASEVATEIAALKAAKSYAPQFTKFGENNHESIDRQVEFLSGDIDTTAEEFEEFSSREQSAIAEAEEWLESGGEAPSAGWDIFKKK